MDYKVTTIEAVVMGAKKLKEKQLVKKSRPFLTFSKMFDQNIPTIEQGNIFAVYQKTRPVSYNFYIIPSSRFEQITMKLNIYSVKIMNRTDLFYRKTSSTKPQLQAGKN